jgi:hypothetical protein
VSGVHDDDALIGDDRPAAAPTFGTRPACGSLTVRRGAKPDGSGWVGVVCFHCGWDQKEAT